MEQIWLEQITLWIFVRQLIIMFIIIIIYMLLLKMVKPMNLTILAGEICISHKFRLFPETTRGSVRFCRRPTNIHQLILTKIKAQRRHSQRSRPRTGGDDLPIDRCLW